MSVTPSDSPLIICPGFHDHIWTDAFLQGMAFADDDSVQIFPTEKYPACSGGDILNFLATTGCDRTPILMGYSAGAVGMVQAAWVWQQLGNKIAAVIIVDGWGVPLVNNVPCHRLSHDFFTHWSSALLGAGSDSFYADPSVSHAELWQNPQHTGWTQAENGMRNRTTAADFIHDILSRHRPPNMLKE